MTWFLRVLAAVVAAMTLAVSPALAASTGGSGGPLTDRTFLSFTGSQYTSEYHLYAGGLDCGIATIQAKSKLALQRGGGVMIWDISDDATGSASLLSAIAQTLQGGTQPPPTGQNLLANAGFESGSLSSWNGEWHSGVLAHKADTDFPYAGSYKLTHYASSAYEQLTGQGLSVANGTYRASVWVRSSGGQSALRLYAKNHGGAEVSAEIGSGAVSGWTKYTLNNIQVTSGYIEVGVYSNAQAQNWAAFDQFELVKL